MDAYQIPQPIYSPPAPPAPPPAPAPRRSILKPILLVVGMVLVLAAAALAIWYFMGSRQAKIIVEEQQVKIIDQVQNSLADCANTANPEACRQDQIERAALDYQQVEVCELLSGAQHDACVSELARASQDVRICAYIQDKEKAQVCADNIYLKSATANRQISACQSIVDAEKQNGCRTMVGQGLSPAECLAADLGAEFCDQSAVINQAAQAQDPAICQQLENEESIMECLDFVYDDPDFDGLESSLEAGLGTDPRNPDTDGDGFSDGQEVQGGYNPLGDGRL